ncbi:MAG: histidine kinase, partial [Lachnospiraceae bacterium]|nr:histidine kinase [Lachnospiraceae bacterium]
MADQRSKGRTKESRGQESAQSAQVRRKRPRAARSIGTIIAIAVLLVAVTFMNSLQVFRMTASQTRNAGIYQLSVISGQLESTLGDAKNLVMQLAIQAQLKLDDREQLTQFIYDRKRYYSNAEPGFINLYIAGHGWDIVPDFTDREGFVASKRSWYTGAIRNGGAPYITPPYIDVVTGDICFTVSVALGDGDTVMGIDYNMDKIQRFIRQLHENGARNAVIVTGRGVIAGGFDDDQISKPLADVLPEYAAIYSLAKVRNDVVSSRFRTGLGYENLFATRSGSGWYLIVSESDWDLYRTSYLQLFITSILILSLFAVILSLYLSTIRSRRRAEEALASRNAFLTNLSEELSEPLRTIVDHSETRRDAPILYPEEELSKIHEAGKKLSEKLDQIHSYSSIVRASEAAKPGRSDRRQASVTRNRRTLPVIIIFMLIVMVISLYLNNVATWRWGVSQMQSEINAYETQVSSWIYSQKSILDMFCSVISSNPDLLDDYDRCIEYLDRITQQYPEISVSYMANPDFSPSVYMNNGWQPEEGWHVEERQWYIDTMASANKWNISSPYYDEQTGYYCITLSEQVFDSESGAFLGVFGIDFYMDQLVDILGGSYSEESYAFLVDAGGNIINHPYGRYQMSDTRT